MGDKIKYRVDVFNSPTKRATIKGNNTTTEKEVKTPQLSSKPKGSPIALPNDEAIRNKELTSQCQDVARLKDEAAKASELTQQIQSDLQLLINILSKENPENANSSNPQEIAHRAHQRSCILLSTLTTMQSQLSADQLDQHEDQHKIPSIKDRPQSSATKRSLNDISNTQPEDPNSPQPEDTNATKRQRLNRSQQRKNIYLSPKAAPGSPDSSFIHNSNQTNTRSPHSSASTSSTSLTSTIDQSTRIHFEEKNEQPTLNKKHYLSQLQALSNAITKNEVMEEGIFRLGGDAQERNKLFQEFTDKTYISNVELQTLDRDIKVDLIKSLVKKYPGGVFGSKEKESEIFNHLKEMNKRVPVPSIENRTAMKQEIFNGIPEENRNFLTVYFALLNRVTKEQANNKMPPDNIAIAALPNLFPNVEPIQALTSMEPVCKTLMACMQSETT